MKTEGGIVATRFRWPKFVMQSSTNWAIALEYVIVHFMLIMHTKFHLNWMGTVGEVEVTIKWGETCIRVGMPPIHF